MRSAQQQQWVVGGAAAAAAFAYAVVEWRYRRRRRAWMEAAKTLPLRDGRGVSLDRLVAYSHPSDPARFRRMNRAALLGRGPRG